MADLRLVTAPVVERGATLKAWGLVIDAIDEALAVPGGIDKADRTFLQSVRQHGTWMSKRRAVSAIPRGEAN